MLRAQSRSYKFALLTVAALAAVFLSSALFTPTADASTDCAQSIEATATAVVIGKWTNDCPSTHSPGHYARFYTFTLDTPSQVTVSLVSPHNTFLYLLDGADENGAVHKQDDDGGRGHNSRITHRFYPGDYTIEATTYDPATAGYFGLILRVVPIDDPPSFSLDWSSSKTSVKVGEPFTLRARMYQVVGAGEHGGISVSFPNITQADESKGSHSSDVAAIEVLSYTAGLSRVAFHQPGVAIYSAKGKVIPADHLLVESDDPSWPEQTDRTLELRITPKRAGDFQIHIRGWICADGYWYCARVPDSGAPDQQGWHAGALTVGVKR